MSRPEQRKDSSDKLLFKEGNVVVINGGSPLVMQHVIVPSASYFPGSKSPGGPSPADDEYASQSKNPKPNLASNKNPKTSEATPRPSPEDNERNLTPIPLPESLVADRAQPGFYFVFSADPSIPKSFEEFKFCPNPLKTCVGTPETYDCNCWRGVVNSIHLQLGAVDQGGFIVAVIHGSNVSRRPHAAIVGPLQHMAKSDIEKISSFMKCTTMDKYVSLYRWCGRNPSL